MKILFVENRYATYLWDAVARHLIEQGHEVFWIIQNKQFIPKTGKHFFLELPGHVAPYPNKVYNADMKKLLRADRGLRYFDVPSDDHLFYTRDQVSEIINKIKPDLGFGECTLHHELITMQLLKNKKIPYFFPTSCRFPLHRFSFYSYDKMMPFGGSGEQIDLKEALSISGEIGNRDLKPIYLKNLPLETPGFYEKIRNKIKIITGRWQGDKYNTPGIFTKIKLNRKIRTNIRAWNALAYKRVTGSGDFKILYPLQMQPEMTIDVWATDFNNQTEIVKKILANTPGNVRLMVKPNPTSAMEITDELIELAKSEPRIIPLHHALKMDDVIDDVKLVITTTGTIGMECIFANKPVLTLVDSFLNKAGNCIFVKDFSVLDKYVQSVAGNSFPKLTDMEKADYLNYLNRTSFEGTITCTFLQKQALLPGNVKKLSAAFLSILNQWKLNSERDTSIAI